MSVYVDMAIWKKSANGRKSYAHLIADTHEELHAFAVRIGIKPHFFHKSAKWKHYDITEEQRVVAINAGAVAVTSKELVLIASKVK